jgi:transcriptional regulator with XRE-family HTH domain
MYGITYMTTAEQLGKQIRAARLAAGLSLRKLGAIAEIPATTIEGYEAGASIPAEKLARIANAVAHTTFQVDGYRFTVSKDERDSRALAPDQMTLDFAGEYGHAKAQVKIGPTSITIHLEGMKSIGTIVKKASGFH